MLIVFGSMNMDLVSRVARLPVPGETLIGSAFFQAPGGKGANQAVAARRTGAAVAMVGCVGADSFGETFLHDFAADGIDVRGVRKVPGVATGIGQIALGEDGQNQIIVCPGANFSVGAEEFAWLERLLPQARALLLQLEVPMEANVRAVAMAAKHGVPVLLDPAPAQTLPPELVRGSILKPNATEAAALVGGAVSTAADAKRAAHALLRHGAKGVIVTLGEHGGYYAMAGDDGVFATFPVKAIDTVAAGDAFQGAFAAALAEGKPFGEAVRWGAAAGALATTKLGAMPSLPTRAEVEALLRR
ncbi:MAG TPA: ribokinase [bacterium]